MVRKSLSVCGTSPKVSGANGHAGYRFSRRKHVVPSQPAGNAVGPPGRWPRLSASVAATVSATRDMAFATSCITPLLATKLPVVSYHILFINRW
jgi:hypothetical protein